ncbi:RsmF rRNA methyltransferase first C-terminal domain-containing protein [Effusibacillus pohliae]|uniref:RsmF rRNA methyltransferase first C-terminal domain-containing protein n=1 Tax=Effusibacillus pohliae TaxID=232270 RepID=UPI000375D127|nr:RsmB/NOP family class I SAM-dependent RNA methyltransferase [Effusibacillus pohliae]
MKGLPQVFISRMSKLLGDEAALFFNSYTEPKTTGLRVNTLKIPVAEFLAISPFRLEQVAWAPQGFYYQDGESPGKHVFHTAGLYYIQEPSAMSIAPALAPQPGERVLDLCAAPGGKATHLAAYMEGRGILVANEFTASRAKILAENIERLGVRNAVVLNETPARLAAAFPGWFDRILVDAPCSGEGMFRKDQAACEEWSPESAAHCAVRQLDILEEAAKMLRPGGKLVYSTCTFAPEENEAVLDGFLARHPEFVIRPFPNAALFSPARPEWGQGRSELQHAVRLWPHRLRGEGHFAALLEKTDGPEPRWKPFQAKAPAEAVALFQSFVRDNLSTAWPAEHYLLQGGHLYRLPDPLPDLKGLKWVRPGLHLGELKKNRFEPSHTLAMTLQQADVVRSVSFHPDDPNIHRYLRGETLLMEREPGWTLVCVLRFPLGWGKVVQGTLKNHYPKGLRIP